jgi:hypothetical protein
MAELRGKANPAYRHGMVDTPTFRSWAGMMTRCTNERTSAYKDYGGRGIKVCTRWHDFTNFLADMGVRPEGTSLDRIDNNGNYEPSNCRWATRREQNNNSRHNIVVTVGGESKTVKQWARALGLPYPTLLWRVNHGWPIERLFAKPGESRP